MFSLVSLSISLKRAFLHARFRSCFFEKPIQILLINNDFFYHQKCHHFFLFSLIFNRLVLLKSFNEFISVKSRFSRLAEMYLTAGRKEEALSRLNEIIAIQPKIMTAEAVSIKEDAKRLLRFVEDEE